jgi:ribosome-associated translation inhibitor RaiA
MRASSAAAQIFLAFAPPTSRHTVIHLACLSQRRDAMGTQLNIHFHQLPHSDALEADIRERFDDLEKTFGNITACRVFVEQPHRHQHAGRLFAVRIDLHVSGSEIVAGRTQSDDDGHADAHVAVRDAFAAARRQLEHHVGRRRSKLKLAVDALANRKTDA